MLLLHLRGDKASAPPAMASSPADAAGAGEPGLGHKPFERLLEAILAPSRI